MRHLARKWKLPLLAKELTEQAARKRTYVIRFAYTALLFVVTCVLFYGNLSSDGTTSVLGRGRPMFIQLVTLQFWGIYLLLPATVCGVISSEKEKESLSLLMLTTLTPWQIIIQKLFGRLIPMFSFLFISFPLMAIAFSNGGVTMSHLWSGIFLLALTCLQVGSFSIACSSFFRTTHEAFVASYLCFLLLCYLIPGMFAPNVFTWAEKRTLQEAVMGSTIIIGSIGGFLFFARVFLESRAFVPARNYLLELFRLLDGIFTDMNHVTGGIVLTKDVDLLPGTQPVAWRETSKKSLGTVRYLFRVLVVLELPLLWTFQLIRGPSGGTPVDIVTVLLYVLWGVSVAMVAVHAAGLVSSERSRQTLDVLLTTPIAARNIILQKFRGVRRLICVLSVPFLSIYMFEKWFKSYGWDYVLWSTVFVLIYLPLTAWFSMWLGVKIRSQVRATLVAICLVVTWATLPLSIQYLLASGFNIEPSGSARYLLILSPTVVIRGIESGAPAAYGIPDPDWAFYLANAVFYGFLLWLFRHVSLKDADHRLGRTKGAAG
jgi:ABC-type transport system involved in multi-copper enzyme maturation permease subunit